MEITLEALGFTKDELQERVIDRLCRQIMQGTSLDEDGEQWETDSTFARKLNERVREQIDVAIDALAAKHVLPNVAQYVENLSLQETNKWGESKGKSVTFIEYLVQRAEAYMQEPVDFQGRVKGQDSFSWKGTQTRLTHLVHEHLHYSIEAAMKQALQVANSKIAKGIEETVRLKLEEVSKALKVECKTR
jgi:hypothetical protein